MHNSRRGSRTGFESGQGVWRGSRDNNLSGGEKFSFKVSEDGSEFHFCHHAKMEADSNLLKNYKSSLKFFGGYSEDDDKNFSDDKSFLRFLNTDYLPKEDSKEKEVQLDLNTAKDDEKLYSGSSMQSSENFFKWIESNVNKLDEILSCETKFVSLKNVFSKLLNIPYGYNDDVNFYAVYSNGIVYLLCQHRIENGAHWLKINRWGHKFQQFLTYGENVNEGVVCNRDYRCVMTAKLGPHNLLFSATTDCFNPDICDLESLDPRSSVLLNCCSDNIRKKPRSMLERMYYWCYSLVSMNIPHVLVGFRTDEAMVKLLKLYTEDDLRQHGKGHWDLNVGFTFAKNALSFIEKTTKAKPGIVFSFTKRSRTNHIKAEETNRKEFPPKWFTKKLEKTVVLDHGSQN